MTGFRCLILGTITFLGATSLHAQELPRRDLYGDPLPENVLARLGTTRFRFPFYVQGLTYSPDGQHLAGLCHTQVYLWESSTGKVLRCWSAANGFSSGFLHFSSDGRSIIRAEEKMVRIWHVGTGKEQRSFPITDRPLYSDLTSDGRWLAVNSAGDPYRVWDVDSGNEVGQMPWEGDRYLGIAWVPGAKILGALALDNDQGPYLRLWDVPLGTVSRLPLPKEFKEPRMAFSSDGKTLAVTHGNDIQLYDWRSGAKGEQLKGHRQAVHNIVFSPLGDQLASTSYDNSVRLWPLKKGKKEAPSIRITLAGAKDSSLAFSPDGKRLAGRGEGQEIRIWNTATGKDEMRPVGPIYQSQPIGFFADNRTLLTYREKDGYRLWDSVEAKEIGRILPRAKSGWCALSSSAKYLAVAQSDLSLAVWEIETGKKVLDLPEPLRGAGSASGLHQVAFSPDDRILAAGNIYGRVSLYEVGTWKLLQSIGADNAVSGFWHMAFSPDSQVLALAAGSSIQGWNKAGKKIWDWPVGHPEYAYSIAFSPDGRILASAAGDTIRLREVSTGKVRAELPWPDNQRGVSRIAFSRDGRMLVGLSADSLAICDPFMGTMGFHRHQPWGFSEGMTWSADGARIATGGADSTLLIWDALALHPKAVAPIRLSDQELEALWPSLADPDNAYAAKRKLAQSQQQGLDWLRNKYPPAKPVDRQQLTRLLVDLNSDRFQVRDEATNALRRLGDSAQALLEEALMKAGSLEERERLRLLVEPWRPSGMESARLECALEVARYLGSAGAQKWLAELAEGAPGAVRTEAAKRALKTWSFRP